ncbi:MAG: B12-binding domain-containing radical SAM protein [Planctomycetota bacterium]|jgi:radical SAM superfamily enzyme YgiQ (UPF0313 family)
MRYEGKIYRPPSEADSLILQATIGCSYNRCAYCAMYLDKRFRPRPPEELREDMAMAQAYYGAGNVRRVFLADGDALILRTSRLLEILSDLHAHFPELQRVSVYASPQSLLAKTVPELEELKAAGLTLHYVGPETGHPEVMRRITKGVTPEQIVDGCRRVIDAGAKLSAIFLLGVGGTELSHEHAVESGRLASAIEPHYLSVLTLVPVPGTPIHDQVERGELQLPDPRALLGELREMIQHTDVRRSLFRTNHASNAVPLAGTLPRDKPRILATLDAVIADDSLPLRSPPSPHRL